MKQKEFEDYSWINSDPEEVDTNADGSLFIPIFFVEGKLTRLDPFWGTENFRFQLVRGASGAMFASGSLEIVVMYGGRTRRLVGAATQYVPADLDYENPTLNTNYEAVIKSECIKNGVKAIGKAFGSALNERDVIASPANKSGKTKREKPPAVKMKPTEKIQAQYNKAYEEQNGLVTVLEAIYEIEYNGTGEFKISMGDSKTNINAES